MLPPPIRAKGEQVIPLAAASVRRAIEAGVNIAFGTDAGVYPHGDNAKEFAAMVDRGMTPLGAIRSATTNAACKGWTTSGLAMRAFQDLRGC